MCNNKNHTTKPYNREINENASNKARFLFIQFKFLFTIAGFKNIKSGFEGRKKQSQTSYFNPLSEVNLDAIVDGTFISEFYFVFR